MPNLHLKQICPESLTSQKDLLQELVTKYKNVTENKCTDTVSINAKAKACQKLCAQYNSRPFACPQDAKQLKKLWNNTKQRWKRENLLHSTAPWGLPRRWPHYRWIPVHFSEHELTGMVQKFHEVSHAIDHLWRHFLFNCADNTMLALLRRRSTALMRKQTSCGQAVRWSARSGRGAT